MQYSSLLQCLKRMKSINGLETLTQRLIKTTNKYSNYFFLYMMICYFNNTPDRYKKRTFLFLFPFSFFMLLQQYSFDSIFFIIKWQIDITELKEKVILLLLSKPELLPIEPFHFLLQQLYDHPTSNTEQNYEILWIPIPTSHKWTHYEQETFTFFSNSLPWISVRRPWLMSHTVLDFLREEWPYRDGETMVVVMDPNGKVVNMNAMDMVLIWGVRAYPFSVSREDELWEEDGWSLQLLLDGIHPAFDTWVLPEIYLLLIRL